MPATTFIGKTIIELPYVDSTNNYAHTLLGSKGVFEGTVIRTDHQTAGKGYSGNKWESEKEKNLLVSIILKPGFLQVKQQFFLTQAISLAVADAVAAISMLNDVKIKWPNDVLHRYKKVAGILIENSVQGEIILHSVVGIGLNVNQTDFPRTIKPSTSLKMMTGKDFDLRKVLDVLCENIEYRYLQLRSNQVQEIQKDYMKNLYRVDEEAVFIADNSRFNAKIAGLTAEGKLVLHVGDQHKVFGFKEVEMVL
ncbi:MAG: biotin--[acetyl-CoA-carboxylase] ligase [Chitinophagales bacterium]|jgi:BirA family biotin operon repressor/biotin-[acetyl-CoA-carboxylase] ligase|nr:biotin--[acetyl-CoA-carboxylase] ligase [Chitinophagales bacterium]